MALLNAVSEIINSSDSIYVPRFIIYEQIVHICIKHQPVYRNFVIQKFLFCSFRKEKSNISSCPECIVNRIRSEEHTSELQSRGHLVCRLLLEKKRME